jgi:hypothetical protein
METVNEKVLQYRQIIEDLLTRRSLVPYLEKSLRDRLFIDEKNDRYALIVEGWSRDERVYNVVIDLEINNGKIWIQADNTDVSVARELESKGVPKSDIVLGFRAPSVRPYTEYAVA